MSNNILPYYEPPQQQNLINEVLPEDLFRKIFSYLQPANWKSARKVCHFWNDIITGSILLEKLTHYRNFLCEVVPFYKKDLLKIDLKQNISEKKFTDQKIIETFNKKIAEIITDPLERSKLRSKYRESLKSWVELEIEKQIELLSYCLKSYSSCYLNED